VLHLIDEYNCPLYYEKSALKQQEDEEQTDVVLKTNDDQDQQQQQQQQQDQEQIQVKPVIPEDECTDWHILRHLACHGTFDQIIKLLHKCYEMNEKNSKELTKLEELQEGYLVLPHVKERLEKLGFNKLSTHKQLVQLRKQLKPYSLNNYYSGMTDFAYLCSSVDKYNAKNDIYCDLLEYLLKDDDEKKVKHNINLDLPTIECYGDEGFYPLYFVSESPRAFNLLLKYGANPLKVQNYDPAGGAPKAFLELAIDSMDASVLKYGFKHKLLDMNSFNIYHNQWPIYAFINAASFKYNTAYQRDEPEQFRKAVLDAVLVMVENCTPEVYNMVGINSISNCNLLCHTSEFNVGHDEDCLKKITNIWQTLVNNGVNVEPSFKCKHHKPSASKEYRNFIDSIMPIELHFFGTSQRCFAFSKESLWKRLAILMKPERRFYVEVQIKTRKGLKFIDLDDLDWEAIPNKSVMKAMVPTLFANMTRKQSATDTRIETVGKLFSNDY